MPLLAQYLLKLSCSLALVYLFYQLVLRRLTFYTWNRWYLLLYSALSFYIPFINISGFIEAHQLSGAGVVRLVPALETYTGPSPAATAVMAAPFTIWDAGLCILVLGAFVLLARLIVQYISYRSIRKGAQLISDDGIKVYQTAKAVTPFSFGNAIFINQTLQGEKDLQEIIRHEFVHIRQRHTVDIIWMELLCILNWYNPAAWGLRHAVRQNLEFIADSHVIQSGVDKKEYQYLLLKVMGTWQFRIAAPFNFSSLKKRIVMMNKMKSAKAHLVKFLFILPLLAVLLIAFRNSKNTNEAAKVTIAGLVIDAATELPVGNVSLVEIYSNVKATADERGFFSIVIPVERYPLTTEIRFEKEGFETAHSKSSFDPENPKPDVGFIEFVNLVKKGNTPADRQSIHSMSLSGDGDLRDKMTYDAVLKMFKERKSQVQTEKKLQELIKESEKPYWIVDGRSFIVSNGGSWASHDEVTDIVFVDGKKMTGEEVNQTIKNSSYTTVSALGGETAKKKYGINQPIFEIHIKTKPEWDTIPTPPAVADTIDDYRTFLKRNPAVKSVHWIKGNILILLKSGQKELYDLKNAQSIAAAEKKWGALPSGPPRVLLPSQPPVPSTPPVPNMKELSVDEEATTTQQELQEVQLAESDVLVENDKNKEDTQVALLVAKEKRAKQLKKQKETQLLLIEQQHYNAEKQKAVLVEVRQNKAAQQQYQKDKQQYLQEKQLASLEQQKALLMQKNDKKAEAAKEQKAAQEQLQKKQKVPQKKQASQQ